MIVMCIYMFSLFMTKLMIVNILQFIKPIYTNKMRKRQTLSSILHYRSSEMKMEQVQRSSIKLLQNNFLDQICLTQHSYIKNKKIKMNTKQIKQAKDIDKTNYSNLICTPRKIDVSESHNNTKHCYTNKSYHYVKLKSNKNVGSSGMKIYKQKPLIRSYIIKDNQVKSSTKIQDYNNEHMKLNSLLNQCINREAIIVYEPNSKNSLVKSFSNLRVKKCLMKATIKNQSQHFQSTNDCKILNPQNSPKQMQNICKSLQNEDSYIHNIEQKIRNMNKLKTRNSPTQKSLSSTRIFDPSFSQTAKNNYNGYLWQGKQKKIKQTVRNNKSRPGNCSKFNEKKQQFFNIKMIKIQKNSQSAKIIQNQSLQQQRKFQLRQIKTQHQQEYITNQFTPIKIIKQYMGVTNRYTKVEEEFTALDEMKSSTKKRRISVATSSPSQYKQQQSSEYKNYLQMSQQLQQKGRIRSTKQQQKDEEQDNTSYLKTINI